MLTFFSVIHVLLCVFMLLVILLQPGKDAGMGAALGGGAATSAFGGRGAVTFLGKVTGACAAGFFITSLGLSFVGLRQSVAHGGEVAPVSAPATPSGPPPTGIETSPDEQPPPAEPAPSDSTP
jgi:preprotein translocase subunit SecG